MGFIANLAASADKASFSGSDQGRAVWRQVFENTSKEEGQKEKRPVRGNSYERSAVSDSASFKRLLQAMRSMAPGGWSDDRYEQSRHYVGITYVASHRTGEQMGQAEFQVFEKDERHPDGKKPVMRGHPGYKLVEILERPNNDDSFGDLMYMWNQQMDLTGTALTWMVPNQLGVPMELYPIPTATAIPQPTINPDYPDGFYRIQPLYPYGPFSSYPTPSTAVGAAIPAQWMLRFKFPHPLLRYEGYSPLTAMRLHLDEVESIDRSRWYSMKRMINPSAVLNFDEMDGMEPLPEPEIDRIVAQFENEHQGPEATGRLFVATPGAKLERWDNNLRDMEYKDGWEQLVSFVLGGFGITKPAAGMVEDSSYSTLFATLKQFHLLTLKPKCARIASKITRCLAPFFADDLIVEIRCPRIDDHDFKNGKLTLLMNAKAITKNELRKELEMPLTKEEWGEEIAGTEQPPEQEGMSQGANEDLPGVPLGPETDSLGVNQSGEDEATRQEPPEISQERPDPGKLGLGALGPRKHLNGVLNGSRMR